MSPKISRRRLVEELDTFAILDADSDEARAITTYLGYWSAFADLIEPHE